MPLKLGELEFLSTKIFSKYLIKANWGLLRKRACKVQKCEWKIISTEKTRRKRKRGKNFIMKTPNWFLKCSQEHQIHNSCDLPKFYNFLVNPQTLNDARHTFFKRWLIISNFELLTDVFRSWEQACWVVH